MNYLDNLMLTSLACHIIKKDEATNIANRVQESHTLLNFEAEHLLLLKQRLTSTLGTGSDSIEMIYAQHEPSETIRAILPMLTTQTDDDFFASTKTITRLLADAQSHKRIPEGPVFVIKGTTFDDNRPFMIILKSEYTEGFSTEIGADERLNVKMLSQLFLTKGQKFHKISFVTFHDPTLTGAELYNTNNWI